jgi:hypothetical protein
MAAVRQRREGQNNVNIVLDGIMGNTLCRRVSAESISAERDQPMVNKVDVVILL